MAVRGQYHPLLIHIARPLRKRERNAASQCHIALAGVQCLTGDHDGDQRCRTSGLDCQTWSAQIQFVRYAGTEKVFVVPEHNLIAADASR